MTGSYIQGSAEDAALPVDVISRSDLEAIGNPTLIEMVRNMGVSSGNLGETNQFDTRAAQGNEGVVTVNLRGLGSARTLVLINNRRHVATESLGVDISMIPSIALERIEVLKDGAAATYGSDAIGGVVNFITRDRHEGLEVRGSFMDISDSDGDSSISLIYGGKTPETHYALSFEYAQRSELKIRDRDWALRPFWKIQRLGAGLRSETPEVFSRGCRTVQGDGPCLAVNSLTLAAICLGDSLLEGFVDFNILSLEILLKIRKISKFS